MFGGRIKGETRQSSSRITRGPPQNIAGITVPAKPEEPDNCCMSGCINCVWELFNDDLKEWADLRNKAADRLVKVGGRWPEDFHPPTRKLKRENMPLSMANMKIDHRNLKLDHEEAWGNAPVSMRVFAEMEKKMKQRRAREGKLEA